MTRMIDNSADEPTRLTRIKTKDFGSVGVLAGILVFILVFIYFSIAAPKFLSSVNLIRSLLMPASIAVVIALAMTVVMTGGGVDLSVASIAGLSAILAAALGAQLDLNLPMMIVVAVLGGMVIGSINGWFVGYLGISPFVVTLSMVFLANGLQFLIALVTSTGTYIMLPMSVVKLAGNPLFLLLISLIMSIIIYVFLDHTVHGRNIRAIGQNLNVAEYSGIRTRKYVWLTYIISGILSAISGVMLTSVEGMARTGSGSSYLIDAFMLPILGQTIFGKFSVQGTLFGALFMYMLIDGMFILGTPPEYVRIVKGSLLLIVILVSGIQKIRSN